MKTPGSCRYSGTWTPYPLILSHRSSPRACWLHIRSCSLTRSRRLLPICPSRQNAVLPVNCELTSVTQPTRGSHSYRAAVPFGTWHRASKKQTHFPQVTAVTMRSLCVHTQCVMRTAVSLFVSSAEGSFWGPND